MSEEPQQEPKSQSESEDRRTGGRIPTRRSVLFSSREHEGPTREGTAVDISSGGLCIHTRYTYPLGTLLDIELEAETKGGEPVFFQGRVMHTTEIGQGQFALGVRLRHKRPAIPPTSGGDGSGNSRFIRRLDGLRGKGTQRPVNPFAVPPRAPAPPAPAQRSRRWWWLAGLLLLFFSLAPALNLGVRDRGFPSGPLLAEATPTPHRATTREGGTNNLIGGGNGRGVFYAATRELNVWPASLEDAPGSPGTAMASMGYPEDPMARRSALVYGPLTDGSLESAAGAFVGHLAEAEGQLRDGEREQADAALHDAMKLVSAVPHVWRDELRHFLTASRAGLAALNSMESFSDEVRLEPASGPPGGEEANVPLLIQIDRSAFTLEVFEFGESTAVFPVGLGEDNATPEGNFRVVDKLVNPDWYNRGDVVPAGSPANPLGSRWMGLGKRGKGTGYGIHGTPDATSIGQAKSRGCIRMRPADVEALFRMCPLGTPVRILS